MYILTITQKDNQTINQVFEAFEQLQDFAKDYPDAKKYVVEDRSSTPTYYEDINGKNTDPIYDAAIFPSLDDILKANPDEPFVTRG